jgi:hypothetical protein
MHAYMQYIYIYIYINKYNAQGPREDDVSQAHTTPMSNGASDTDKENGAEHASRSSPDNEHDEKIKGADGDSDLTTIDTKASDTGAGRSVEGVDEDASQRANPVGDGSWFD